jgi:hypothetical protein
MMRRVLFAALIAAAGGVAMARRRFGRAATAAATAAAAQPAFAVATASKPVDPNAQRYVSGKNPKGKNKEGDMTGTKKDGSYLRCLANCADTCGRADPNRAFQKTRSECLNACRDECCATYEQCTYQIKGE